MMSRIMIASGSSAEAVATGVAASAEEDGVRIREGMGFLPHAMVDQHFLARGRIGRLLVAVLATDSLPLGVGIDENTALVLDGDAASVVGASGVILVDGRQARRSGQHHGSGMLVSLAGTGDAVNLSTFEIRRNEAKTALAPAGSSSAPPDDPFARWAFLQFVADLASSSDDGATFSTGGATLTIRKGEGFSAAMTASDGGVEGTPAGLSAGPLLVDLMPEG
jgi:hypothetical protein